MSSGTVPRGYSASRHQLIQLHTVIHLSQTSFVSPFNCTAVATSYQDTNTQEATYVSNRESALWRDGFDVIGSAASISLLVTPQPYLP
jgi:hypothetical protein